jgi:hypothetical protein
MPSFIPSGIFAIGFTEQDVLDIIAKAKTYIKQGKVTMSYGDSGSSASKQFTLPIDQVLMECQFALKKINPTVYNGGSTKKKRILVSDYRSFKHF